jgi:hypothetical protein
MNSQALTPVVEHFPSIILTPDPNARSQDIVLLPQSTQNGKTGKTYQMMSMRKPKKDSVKNPLLLLKK